MTRIDLRDCTFIIPVDIESPDREQNFLITIAYLCKHLMTNIIILESSNKLKVSDLLKQIDPHQYGQPFTAIAVFEQYRRTAFPFHRTKYLNEMLQAVRTPVTINYDIDVLLKPEAYLKARNAIQEGVDLYYPYFFGLSQYQVNYAGREKVKESLSLDCLTEEDSRIERGEYGHVQFFRTAAYRDGGRENEQFISHAPEDIERACRFQKLGYWVEWGEESVYHLEHTRGANSGNGNPYSERNYQLFERIKRMSVEQLKAYYEINSEFMRKKEGV